VVHGDVEGRALAPGKHLRLHEPGAQRRGATQHGRARGVVALAAHRRAADAVPVAGVRLGARMRLPVAGGDVLGAAFRYAPKVRDRRRREPEPRATLAL
jgi:hypothetical protein